MCDKLYFILKVIKSCHRVISTASKEKLKTVIMKILKSFIVIILLTFSSQSMTSQMKAPDITYSVEANVSADKLWEQIRIMDNIDLVSSYVAKVTWKGPKGVGGERKCVAPDGKGYYVEKVKSFNDDQRTYQWQVTEGVPAKNVFNSFKVVDLGYNKSMIIFRSNFEFMENPNMTKPQFEAFFNAASKEIVGNYIKLAQK
jgi:hypothetical protein